MLLRTITAFVAFAPALVVAATSCAAAPLNQRGGPYELQVLVDGGLAPTFGHAGETYVLGQTGERYTLRIVNSSHRRVEAVVSIDGRDVIDGKPADFRNKRGYLVPAWGHVDVDGWRISQAQAAAFRFSSVADSYAARTGSAREVGVIGLAIFPERVIPPRPQPLAVPPPPYNPYGDPYGGRPHGPGDDDASSTGKAERRSAPSAASPSPGKSAAPMSGGASGSAAAESEAGASSNRQRPGLGTEFGEAVNSRTHEVAFVRANASRPAMILGVRYNDHDGLLAMGVPMFPYPSYGWDDSGLRRSADPFPVSDRRYAAPPAGWRR